MPELSNEERYFLAREAELRRKRRAEMEAKAQAAAKKEALKQHVGGREDLAQRLHELEFDPDNAPALHLLPLIAVAWADGQVTSREREAVLQIAAAHGIQPGSKPALLLTSMLEERPSQTLMDQVLDLLHHLLESKGLHPHSLVEACREVANASGGFLGLGNKVSPEEQTLIESLISTFDAKSRDQVVDKLD